MSSPRCVYTRPASRKPDASTKSAFYNDDCKPILDTVTDDVIEGRVECRILGANCLAGTGAYTEAGVCADGAGYEPIELAATFRLSEAVSQEQTMAGESPPGTRASSGPVLAPGLR